jgi:hypothetical protein
VPANLPDDLVITFATRHEPAFASNQLHPALTVERDGQRLDGPGPLAASCVAAKVSPTSPQCCGKGAGVDLWPESVNAGRFP